MTQPLRHILLFNLGSPERFTSPRLGRGKLILIPRDRQRHGQKLKKQLREAAREGHEQLQQIPADQLVKRGFYIEFESDPGLELKVESLKGERQGIELVAVSEMSEAEDGKTPMKATVFVPEGKIGYFIKKIEEYLDPAKDSKKIQNPRHRPLVESIANIRLATLRSLWTDSDPFPEKEQEIWWEIWLRTEGTEEERKEIVQMVRDQAANAGLRAKPNEIIFPDTTVLLVRGQAEQITQSLFLMNALAEIRRAKETADFFINLKYGEQRDWVKEALSRVVEAEKDAPAVCLLDTGVNREHPLIERSLSEQEMDSYNPAWGKADHHGHGTELAGIGLSAI